MRISPSRVSVDRPADHRRAILLAGTVRSGTTWASSVINHGNGYRYMFEPLYPTLPICDQTPARAHLAPDNQEAQIMRQARAIFEGRVRHARVDQYNGRAISSRRLIKVIHANLMLPWVRRNFPGMPIVLLLRHPCAVLNSLLRLGWLTVLHHITAQETLLSGILHPFRSVIAHADSPFEQHLLLWCVETYVPLHELSPGDVHVLFYEKLCESPEAEVSRLFSYLGVPFSPAAVRSVAKPSPQSRVDSPVVRGSSLTDAWRQEITEKQLDRAMELLHVFGLDRLYSREPMPNVEEARRLMGLHSAV